MSLDQDVVLLQGVPTFKVLAPEALRILAISAEQQRLRPGEVLFQAGDAADCGYVVAAGRLEVFSGSPGKRRGTLEALPGALIGETALLLDRPRPATAAAVEASTVMRIPRTTFLRVLESFPEAAVEMRQAFAQRVDALMRALDTVRDRLETPIRPARRGPPQAPGKPPQR
ncbi:cyclic nucleotide-binding domain-containing protein [Azorhizobium doebereinerae]|uniref:cyclic nucleotide-binding domain-containing protein n=1 Tax=Azorhizobium doebereinerae TaxID=281091 RepID=UPI0004054199|nr:Crp/Fnr family transcriptional regulator [Azorhizobium doebereinerae]